MKFLNPLLIAATLATPLATLAADHQEHGSAAPPKIELNAGKKWAIDAPLRQAMTALRSSVAATLPAAHAGKATAVDYDALGKEVTGQVSYMVQNCKLDPKADAQLHTIIGDIMNGAEAAEGKQPGKDRASGVDKIAQGLNTYGKYFDHPGWQAIKLPH
jgi:hypothetical protein